MTRHASTRRERLAQQPARAAILAAVRERPGILLSDLRRRLGCSAGTIQYHVKMLERGGHVVSLRSRRRHRVFPPGVPAADRSALALLSSGRIRELAERLLRGPGSTRRDLGPGLSLGSRALRGHLERLALHGLVLVSGDPAGPTFTATGDLVRLLRTPAGTTVVDAIDADADAVNAVDAPSAAAPRAEGGDAA